MHLQLTSGEFDRLLKLAYLGEAVMNDWTPTEDLTAEQRAATDLLYDLCAMSSGAKISRYVAPDDKSGSWIPSRVLRREAERIIADYDNEVFWDELIERMSYRDLIKEYGKHALSHMSDKYRHEAEMPFFDYYLNEIYRHGITRFSIRDEMQDHAKRNNGRRGSAGRGIFWNTHDEQSGGKKGGSG